MMSKNSTAILAIIFILLQPTYAVFVLPLYSNRLSWWERALPNQVDSSLGVKIDNKSCYLMNSSEDLNANLEGLAVWNRPDPSKKEPLRPQTSQLNKGTAQAIAFWDDSNKCGLTGKSRNPRTVPPDAPWPDLIVVLNPPIEGLHLIDIQAVSATHKHRAQSGKIFDLRDAIESPGGWLEAFKYSRKESDPNDKRSVAEKLYGRVLTRAKLSRTFVSREVPGQPPKPLMKYLQPPGDMYNLPLVNKGRGKTLFGYIWAYMRQELEQFLAGDEFESPLTEPLMKILKRIVDGKKTSKSEALIEMDPARAAQRLPGRSDLLDTSLTSKDDPELDPIDQDDYNSPEEEGFVPDSGQQGQSSQQRYDREQGLGDSARKLNLNQLYQTPGSFFSNFNPTELSRGASVNSQKIDSLFPTAQLLAQPESWQQTGFPGFSLNNFAVPTGSQTQAQQNPYQTYQNPNYHLMQPYNSYIDSAQPQSQNSFLQTQPQIIDRLTKQDFAQPESKAPAIQNQFQSESMQQNEDQNAGPPMEPQQEEQVIEEEEEEEEQQTNVQYPNRIDQDSDEWDGMEEEEEEAREGRDFGGGDEVEIEISEKEPSLTTSHLQEEDRNDDDFSENNDDESSSVVLIDAPGSGTNQGIDAQNPPSLLQTYPSVVSSQLSNNPVISMFTPTQQAQMLANPAFYQFVQDQLAQQQTIYGQYQGGNRMNSQTPGQQPSNTGTSNFLEPKIAALTKLQSTLSNQAPKPKPEVLVVSSQSPSSKQQEGPEMIPVGIQPQSIQSEPESLQLQSSEQASPVAVPQSGQSQNEPTQDINSALRTNQVDYQPRQNMDISPLDDTIRLPQRTRQQQPGSQSVVRTSNVQFDPQLGGWREFSRDPRSGLSTERTNTISFMPEGIGSNQNQGTSSLNQRYSPPMNAADLKREAQNSAIKAWDSLKDMTRTYNKMEQLQESARREFNSLSNELQRYAAAQNAAYNQMRRFENWAEGTAPPPPKGSEERPIIIKVEEDEAAPNVLREQLQNIPEGMGASFADVVDPTDISESGNQQNTRGGNSNRRGSNIQRSRRGTRGSRGGTASNTVINLDSATEATNAVRDIVQVAREQDNADNRRVTRSKKNMEDINQI